MTDQLELFNKTIYGIEIEADLDLVKRVNEFLTHEAEK